MHLFFKSSVASVLAIALSSCTALPRSGPEHEDIVSEASLVVANGNGGKQKPVQFNYVLLDITKNILPYFEQTYLTSFAKGFSDRGVPKSTLGVGDVVQVTIFEAQSGGLFIPQDAGSRPGNYITLPSQTVDQSGMITVPYAGAVRAAGRVVSDVESDVAKRLMNRAIEPQVLITVVTSRSGTVSILGDVNNPARLDLSPGGERLLDIIARAGGLSASSNESYVTVERNGHRETATFKSIIANSAEDIYVHPGDTVYVSRDRRTYEVFGAANLNGRINFEDSDLTLGEALGQGGGLLDSRADPQQVFLYRTVARTTLEKAGVDVSKFADSAIPVVFRVNMRDPGMFFAMQKFRMQDKDIIYVSNAKATEIEKFLNLVNGISNTTANVPVNARAVRDAVKGF